jgi:hypothetical protein
MRVAPRILIQNRHFLYSIIQVRVVAIIHSYLCIIVYKPDPYVRVRVVGTPNPAQETKHIPNTLNPRFVYTLQ